MRRELLLKAWDIAAGEGGQYSQQPSSLSIEELIKFYKGSDYYKDVFRLVSSEKATQATLFRTSSIRASLQGNDVLVTEAPSVESCACVRVGDKVTGVCERNEEFQYVESSDSASKVSYMLKASYSSILLQLERNLDEAGNAMYYQRHFGWQQFCSWWLSTWCLIRRQTIFVMRLKGLAIVRLLQILLVGLFTGSLFYHKGGRLDQYEMNSMRTIGFISMMTLMLINIVQLPVHIVFHRPVFYKQQGQHLFPVSSYVVAHAILNIPQSVIEALLYSLCVYFLASLSKEKAAHYVQYLGLIFVTAYLGSLWMLLVGAIAPMLEVATTMGGSFVALNLLFSGSTIIPSVISWYWRWVLYITPTRWGNVIFTSTQTDNRYELPCTLYRTYPFCLLHPTLSLGQAFLKYYELEAGGKRLVLAFGVIVAYILVLIYLAYLAYSKVRIQETASAIPRQKQYVRGPNNVEQAENGGTRAPGRWTCKLSVKPVTLSFHQLRFTRRGVRSSFEQVVLDNVSGYAKPGTMLAIAGGTRSGKATLLNCIAGRLPPGKLEGDVSLNGLKLDRLAICRISGFAEKLEAHQQYLTVRESLEFSANLRLGKQISADDKARHVTEVLELLGLSAMSNQLVGNLKLVTARIQETRRKLTIAVELAVNPGILFLEDPTAQLDGTSSREILRLLQSVALSGRTIISMLDHPSGEALSVFNDVLVLAIGGHTAYFGPVGWNCKQVLHYFTSVPSSPPYNEQWNPVTYILGALGGGIKERKPLHDFSQLYQSSSLHQANAEVLERLLKQQPDPELKNISSRYAASFKTQAAMVFLRNQRFLWRNVTYTLRRLLGTILVALVMGTLYLNISVEKLLSMTSASLFPYIQLIMISGLTANNVIPQLGTDRLVYYRENRARMYSPMLYPLSWAIAEVPYLLLGTLAFVGIGNGLANLAVDSVSAFVQYWIGLFLFTLAVTYFGIFVTLLFPNSLLAMTVSSISTSVWVASSGVSIPRYNIQFYKWLYWINPYQYAVNILTTTAFHCDTGTPACNACTIGASCPGCKCKRLVDLEKKLVQIYGPVFSQFIRASFVWERLSKARVLEKHRIGKDFLALAFMVLLFAVLAIVSFARLKHNRK
ncbi:ABC transporter G family member 43 isoform X2 [Selaginella moellendorffii]|uniref:ABC transporter G family member 43 isoform X2 n=1 Tax=Selaginella moellendorffii TaxID=88036 RepID=UPI000D1CBD50|nr:ABC transporter G family member 43 isoform X2 [Selaginella moellendorffii]|eukprot:XP_002969153.2 ABC transporter G family member 43 isoform X2 [Selaginella moellendorffii]